MTSGNIRSVEKKQNTFSRLNASTSVAPTNPSDAKTSIINAKYCPTIKKYDNHLLSEFEKKGIENVKKKLKNYFEFLKKYDRTPKDVGMSNDLEVNAQNLVCQDRFLNRTFIRPISFKNNKKVDSEAHLKVKLLISDLGNNFLLTKLMNFFSNSDFGIVHTGLLIGEWKIEWNDSSIVNVRCDSDKSIEAKNTLAALDIGTIIGSERVKDTLKTISEIICKYNGTVQYDRFKANCQHFTSEILSALGLPLPSSECFEKYFENLKKGKFERIFYFSQNLKKLVKSTIPNEFTNRNSITFQNRKSLNEFCHFIDKLGYFETDEGDKEFWLLKAFDRSFVLKLDMEVDVISESGGMKDNCFFTGESGLRNDNSISGITYSVKGVDFSDCNLRE